MDKSDGTLHSDCALADRANMVYSSGLVTYGRAVVLVTATGMDTEIGKIAALMNATKEKRRPFRSAWTSSAAVWPWRSWSYVLWCFC